MNCRKRRKLEEVFWGGIENSREKFFGEWILRKMKKKERIFGFVN